MCERIEGCFTSLYNYLVTISANGDVDHLITLAFFFVNITVLVFLRYQRKSKKKKKRT